MRIINTILFWLTLPLYPFFYILCRLEAKECPYCGEKWYTELVGEWDGEDWKCQTCGKYWQLPYGC